jgi:hypothetical protein
MFDAVISPPNSPSDCLDLDLTPSCVHLMQAVMNLTLDALLVTPSCFFWVVMDFTLDAVRISFLTPSYTVLSMEN